MNIQKSVIRNQYSKKRGYTLVELLAVTSIIVIISGLIVGVLYSTLRGGNKTKVTNDVSQNGNYALSTISSTAILSESVTKVGGIDINDCTTSAENQAKFPQNPDKNPLGASIEFKQSDGSTVAFSCDPETDSIASSSGSTTTYLIDNSSVKVDHTTCSFSCLQSNGDPYAQPIISVSFTVSQRGSGALFENAASSLFDTSVTMRNFSPK